MLVEYLRAKAISCTLQPLRHSRGGRWRGRREDVQVGVGAEAVWLESRRRRLTMRNSRRGQEVQRKVEGWKRLAERGRWQRMRRRGRNEGGHGRNSTRRRWVVDIDRVHETLLGQLGGRSEDLDEFVVVVVAVGPDVPLICVKRLIRPSVDRRPVEATRCATPRC